jgi:tRNA acetyltransferase TAN1
MQNIETPTSLLSTCLNTNTQRPLEKFKNYGVSSSSQCNYDALKLFRISIPWFFMSRPAKKIKTNHQDIPIDSHGFLVSCRRGKERQAKTELLSLVEEYIHVDYKDDGLSVEDRIKNEMAMLKKKKFSCFTIGSDCLVYLKFNIETDPVVLLDEIMADLIKTGKKKTMYVSRILPFQSTCVANAESIKNMLPKILANLGTTPVKFAIIPKSTNNTHITREYLIKIVAELVDPMHTVDLKNPDVVILINVLKTTCGASAVRNYSERLRFNLDSICTTTI